VTGSGFAAARAICARACQKHSARRAPCFCPEGSQHERLRAAARLSCWKGTKRVDHKPLRGRSV